MWTVDTHALLDKAILSPGARKGPRLNFLEDLFRLLILEPNDFPLGTDAGEERLVLLFLRCGA